MSNAASFADRSQDHPQVMLDDCRLQLPSNNVFRFCAQNGMPSIATDEKMNFCLRTAAEIEAARKAARTKKKTKGAKAA
jgi:hypothetical protein